ncbi:MAG: sugar transferase, partial [Mucilaginibacter sp.]
MYKYFFKVLIDITASLLGFIVLSPIFVLIILLLLIFNGGNVFFFQRRPGLNGKIFKVIKFKTMSDKRDKAGELLPDAVRLTPLGK